MDRVLVVGSGASGVHFALTLLQKGYPVTMLDVGHEAAQVPNPSDGFDGLKRTLSDPVQYYLGQSYEAVVFPGSRREYYTKPYAFPPNKNYVFTLPNSFDFEATGFEPLFSFAQGGLAEAWTGGVYPLNDLELKDFPFRYGDIEQAYGEVAERIGITGAKDDLERFFPYHDNLMEPLHLDPNSQLLMVDYEKRKDYLQRKYRAYLGRSRVATLSRDKGGRKACAYRGRCLWGCPGESLYTPSITLRECRGYSNFTYVPNMFVSHFKFNGSKRIASVIAENMVDKTTHEFAADKFVLAAGTLSSAKILLDSIWKETGQIVKLTGLMDNRQILIPFVNLKLIGAKNNSESYQYHQLALGIESERPEEYIHAQITTLKTALVHPIIYNVPFDLRTSMIMFPNVRSALGMLNLNLYDWRRNENYVTLEAGPKSGRSKLVINYEPPGDEKEKIKRLVKTVKQVLWNLGCVVPPGMTHIRPMGSSVHYAGTIPMSSSNKPFTSTRDCQSNDVENLYLVDGSTFPFLPAKNLTFTLMANAVRIANSAF